MSTVISEMALRLTEARDRELILDANGRFVLDGEEVNVEQADMFHDLLDDGFITADAVDWYDPHRDREVLLNWTGQQWLNSAEKES